jgi:hypothetical protein
MLVLALGRCGMRWTPGLCASGGFQRLSGMRLFVHVDTVLAKGSVNILDLIGSETVGCFTGPNSEELVFKTKHTHTHIKETKLHGFYVRFEFFTAVAMKNVVFCDIKPQFVLHKKDVLSPLLSPAD